VSVFKSRHELVPLAIRLPVGAAFVYAGAPKLFSPEDQRSFEGMMRQIHAPAPRLLVWLVGLLELGGGLSLLAGAFVRVVSAVLALEIAINVAVALARGGFPKPAPGQQPLPGYALSSAFGACLLLLRTAGAGAWSIDGLRAARPESGG
jgi:putative oxidoreductase